MTKFLQSFIIICGLIGFSVAAQTTKSKKALAYFEQAKTMYATAKPAQALILLDKAIEKDARFTDAYLLKADVYSVMQNFKMESEMLMKAIQIDSLRYLPAYYSLGKSEFMQGNYEQAITWFNKYEVLTKNKKGSLNADEWIVKSNFALEAIKNPFIFEPINLGTNINSDYDEYWPSLTADEQKLVFTVLVPRDTNLYKLGNLPRSALYFQEDFYESNCNEEGIWQLRKAIAPPVNTDGNEGAQTLSADGNWMFFTGCSRSDGKGSCDIYFSQRTASGWTKPVNIDSPVNSPFWESQPSFSADGKTLFFVSNRSGGIGQKDIWSAEVISLKTDGTPIFGNLQNLGSQINTSGDENSPFMHPDGQTLFFSSDGWPGMGNMDIFKSVKSPNGAWQKAINLGFPINTASDEVGFIVNAKGDKAYYSSDGLSGNMGGKDLYVFELPEKLRPKSVSYLKGFVYDDDTKLPLGASFELLSLADGQQMVRSSASKADGAFLLCLPPNQSYALNVSHPGYLFHSGHFDMTISASVSKPQLIEIGLKPIKVGGGIVLNNVFFDSNSTVLKEESHVELEKLVQFMTLNPLVKIELQGHTDNIGSLAFNNDLSTNRAKAVLNYLVLKGVDSKRIVAKGYGFSAPVADNATEEGRALNRRTELKVISK
jgi:hypothetical protein